MRSGDLDAYAELVDRHAPVALRTAVLLGAGADAEDVVQEALVKAYRSLGRYRDGAPFRPWLLRIVANEARNHHRSAVRRGAREQGVPLPPELLDPGEQVADRQRKEQLLAAVGRLPERLRAVVVCRYLLELDEAETATALGVPRGTVKSRLNRGLSRLREQLPTTEWEADRV
ncbi:RNA polymerase sigma factor [Nocardioides caldifontis]|uniref:RNA polymerase sigma factor n=1 Tax=Nocardioides caldifontis TaxID=2588938 RepID=UPI001EEF8641|nr:RNA polymerase sigma factor [Nocardioides caldifontis]